MKATLNKETYTATLDKEAIKAIRFVLGFKTDLRVKLRGVNKESIFEWIEENEHGIFGTDIIDLKWKKMPSPEYDKYIRMIDRVVHQIIEGR